MDLLDINGYSLHNINKINIVLGKNGCGKSTVLKKVQQGLEDSEKDSYSKYITPERGGALKHNANVEYLKSNDRNWLKRESCKNQFSQFKEHTMIQYRALESLILREIEQNYELRNDHTYTFDLIINTINTLLDNIEITRGESDFTILNKANSTNIEPDAISSGESELIALGIECLAFSRESKNKVENILFLDEPDAHLHPDLQIRLALFLKKLVDENNFRIVMATHSTCFLAALDKDPNASIAFITPTQTDIYFKEISDTYRRILPVFGAHPLSNLFNESPILLVEGEDDERIWQQAVRSSQGKLKIYPCATDSKTLLNEYEKQVVDIINSIYDSAKAYSLRDRDEGDENIEDMLPVTRMKLSCRAAENLLLSDESLETLELDWDTVKKGIENWLLSNKDHPHYETMQAFQNDGYARKTFNLKEIRNDLMGIFGSPKPWEVIVGQTIANTNYEETCKPNSLQNFLGEKLVSNLLKTDN